MKTNEKRKKKKKKTSKAELLETEADETIKLTTNVPHRASPNIIAFRNNTDGGGSEVWGCNTREHR